VVLMSIREGLSSWSSINGELPRLPSLAKATISTSSVVNFAGPPLSGASLKRRIGAPDTIGACNPLPSESNGSHAASREMRPIAFPRSNAFPGAVRHRWFSALR
jgi:hypothetical protein